MTVYCFVYIFTYQLESVWFCHTWRPSISTARVTSERPAQRLSPSRAPRLREGTGVSPCPAAPSERGVGTGTASGRSRDANFGKRSLFLPGGKTSVVEAVRHCPWVWKRKRGRGWEEKEPKDWNIYLKKKKIRYKFCHTSQGNNHWKGKEKKNKAKISPVVTSSRFIYDNGLRVAIFSETNHI